MERKYFAVILIIVLAYGVSFFNNRQSTGAASFEKALEDQGGEVASIDAFEKYKVDEAPSDIQAQQQVDAYIQPEIQTTPEQIIQQPSTGDIRYLFDFGASTMSSFPEGSQQFASVLLQLAKTNIVSYTPSANINSIFANAQPTTFKLTNPTARSLLNAIRTKTNSR